MKTSTPKIERLDFSDDKETNIKRICEMIPKISKKDAEELLDIKSINETCDPPETFSEMKESGRMARWYCKKLDKFPLLLELGFDHSDAYDYTQD